MSVTDMSKRLEEQGQMERESLVIIGAGMAATRLVEELVAAEPGRYAIRVIGDEPRLAYNRVLLSSALAGEIGLSDIELRPAEWWRAANVELLTGRKAVAIDRRRRLVALDDGASVIYSRLVLATGSQAVRLPIEGVDLPNVHTFRDVNDVEALSQMGVERKRVLVIGGGLLGLEAAYGLARRGANVTLAHVMDQLMERQLDRMGAAILKYRVEEKGIKTILEANAIRIRGDDRVEAVEFADGTSIETDAVVLAVGIRANADLARKAGLAVGRGVIVDDGLSTSDECIFAIGECAEHRGLCYGLVEPAYEQARVAARRLSGRDDLYQGSIVSTNLKVSGVRVFSAGDFLEDQCSQSIVFRDPRMGVYRKLVVQNDRLKGAILIGDTSGALFYLDLIRSAETIASIRDDLMFGAAKIKKAA
jgi:nitrite reductase (NADH) large subunit